MTEPEKAAKFDQIQAALWAMATRGNLLQSTMAAALIQQLGIPSPEGDEPEQA